MKCKFCKNKMQTEFDHRELYHTCSCEGYRKLERLKEELSNLEIQMCKKRAEIKKHIDDSEYYKMIRKLKEEYEE